jgi:hypothetical protein
MRLVTHTSVAVALGKVERPPSREAVVEATDHLPVALTNPVQDKLADYIRENRPSCTAVVQPNTDAGRSLAICGAGPSLRGARLDTFAAVDDVWACNSALPYLLAAGVPVTAAIGIDQTPGLLREWSDAPDVTYYVASSVDPELVRHLVAHDRRVVFFHNFVGLAATVDEEVQHYKAYPSTFLVLDGFSVTSRAIRVAQHMGYERIDVHGADCCFGPDDTAHANGEHITAAYHRPAVSIGEINGRAVRTRPDMLADAVHLVRLVRWSQGRVRLIGDTLPVQLLGKSESFLELVARRPAPGEDLHAVDTALRSTYLAELSRAPQPQPSPLTPLTEAVA